VLAVVDVADLSFLVVDAGSARALRP